MMSLQMDYGTTDCLAVGIVISTSITELTITWGKGSYALYEKLLEAIEQKPSWWNTVKPCQPIKNNSLSQYR